MSGHYHRLHHTASKVVGAVQETSSLQVSNEIEQHVYVVEEDAKFLKLLEVTPDTSLDTCYLCSGGRELYPPRLSSDIRRQAGTRRRTSQGTARHLHMYFLYLYFTWIIKIPRS